MRKTILCAVLALAACASPEDQATAICGRQGYREATPEFGACFIPTYHRIMQSRAVASANLTNTGIAMMAAGAPRPIYPAAPMMAAPTFPVTCSRWAGGTVICN